MAQLSFPLPNGEIQVCELNGDTVSIGRDPDQNTIFLDDPSVSTQHAQISQQDGQYILRDLGSSNGTMVNGNLVSETTLNHRDGIHFGGIQCDFRLRPSPPPPIPKQPEKSALDNDPSGMFDMEDGGDLGISKAVGQFKKLDYGFLIPFKKVFSEAMLKKKAVRWVMVFGLIPLAIPQHELIIGILVHESHSAWCRDCQGGHWIRSRYYFIAPSSSAELPLTFNHPNAYSRINI